MRNSDSQQKEHRIIPHDMRKHVFEHDKDKGEKAGEPTKAKPSALNVGSSMVYFEQYCARNSSM